MLEQCEQVNAHHDDCYQPFLKQFYTSHRRALFRVIITLDIGPTTSDQALVAAMNFIIANEQNPKTYLEAMIELPFSTGKLTDQIAEATPGLARRIILAPYNQLIQFSPVQALCGAGKL